MFRRNRRNYSFVVRDLLAGQMRAIAELRDKRISYNQDVALEEVGQRANLEDKVEVSRWDSLRSYSKPEVLD